METRTYSISVNLPTIDDFINHFPHYGNFARKEGRFLFERIISPDSFNNATVITKTLELPAVTGIAEICYQLVLDNGTIEWSNFVKQFIGAVVCELMEANGYKKTGIKKSIPHKKFTKGEFYQLGN